MNFIVKSVVAGHRPVYLWDDKNVALLSFLSFRENEKGITYVLHVSVLRAMYCFSYLANKRFEFRRHTPVMVVPSYAICVYACLYR